MEENELLDERQALVAKQTVVLLDMVQQNTQLTEAIKGLTERVEALTMEVHKQVLASATAAIEQRRILPLVASLEGKSIWGC